MKSDELKALLEKLGIRRLVQRGHNWMGCCPFHNENNPSWGISVREPHFHGCFSCGAKGTLHGLLLKKGYSHAHAQALAYKEDPTEFEMPEFGDPRRENVLETIDYRLLFPYSLRKSAIRYLHSRGILTKTALRAKLTYDHIQKRVLFPWYYHGLLVGVTGRAVDPDNRVKTLPYYGTSKGQCLYLPSGKIRPGALCLVEGEIDALKVHQAGFKNVGAFGFGRLSKQQAALIRKSSATEVILFTDDDETGRTIKASAEKQLKDNMYVFSVDYAPFRSKYPEGKLDPGAMREPHIRLALNYCLKRRVSWPEF